MVEGYAEIADIAHEGKNVLLKDWEGLEYLVNKNHEIQDSICDSGEQTTI